jgi:IS66 Orf2 like protein
VIAVTSVRSLWLARYRIDFRKGPWSLLAEAYSLGLNPLEGDAVLFIGRDKRKIKLIYADPTGLWVSYKVFHKSAMKTLIDFSDDKSKEAMTSADLAMLLEGASFSVHKRVQTL